MTPEEVSKRFKNIVSRVLGTHPDSPIPWYRWERQLPTINGKRVIARAHYNGDVAIPGNQDGRGGPKGVN